MWRLLRRAGLHLRSARVQLYSPDPDYLVKREQLEACLRAAAGAPDTMVCVFLDEMGSYRWPAPACDWTLGPPAPGPLADRAHSKQQQWRLIGALNALTGQVDYLDGYRVGRAKVIEMYQTLAARYPEAARIYVIQDNWNIHTHPEVCHALTALPRLEPVWLPTYAPWLNPIEKLWRWLRQDVLKLHRLAGEWETLRHQVRGFLTQFAHGSQELLHYVGLLGNGRLAHACRAP